MWEKFLTFASLLTTFANPLVYPSGHLRLFQVFRQDGRLARICVCPTILTPVCGQDGQQYDNQCQLKCAGVVSKRLHEVALCM